MTVTVHRSDDADFAALPDFPFAPRYAEHEGLRTHYLDEGPRDAPVALLVHGEPTWSYLYRRMIPPLLAAGYRCVAADHIGFGRSDKVVEDSWYVFDRHRARLEWLVRHLDLRRVTLFVQDWGGPIGLSQMPAMPERFARLVIMNTWLHHEGIEYSPGVRRWRDAATNPAWLRWTHGNLPCGEIVLNALRRPPADPAALVRAYEAPYRAGGLAKAGARRFPWCIPFAEPEAGGAATHAATFAWLRQWDGPAHVIFAEEDPIFPPDWGRRWAGLLRNASFDGIPRAGHFVQEDAGEEVVERFLARR